MRYHFLTVVYSIVIKYNRLSGLKRTHAFPYSSAGQPYGANVKVQECLVPEAFQENPFHRCQLVGTSLFKLWPCPPPERSAVWAPAPPPRAAGLQWASACSGLEQSFGSPPEPVVGHCRRVLSLSRYTTRDEGPGLACRLCRDEFPHRDEK